MKKAADVAGNELQRHIEHAKTQGYDPAFLDKIVRSAESPQHAIEDIKGMLSHQAPAERIAPQEDTERVLDPHEAAIHEDMVSGRLKHYEDGKLVQ